ncbi:MAG: HAD family hydrolase [Candidatus Korarchaeota archaeon]
MRHVAMLFDFDGTLVDLNLDIKAIRNKLESYYRAHGYDIEVKRITRTIEGGPKELRSGAWEIVKEFEMDALPRARPVPHALETLRDIRKFAKMGIVSLNSLETIKTALKLFGFPEFDIIVSRENAPALKPEPDGIILALSQIGIPRERSFMVGDSDSDMIAASKANITGIGIARTNFSTEDLRASGAKYVINDFSELPLLLRQVIEEGNT